MSTIHSLTTEHIVADLPRPWGTDVTVNHFIAVTVTDSLGNVGHGFTWTPTIGAPAIRALLDNDIRERAIGAPAEPVELWPRLWSELHEAGSGGVTTIALAGLDTALWDLTARAAHRSVPQLIGVQGRSRKSYASGINRHLDLHELRAQVERWMAAGYDAVKIKLGGRPLDDDLGRVAAVREIIGDTSDLMVDANQLWSRDEAMAAAAALEEFSPAWLEEPLRADDLDGYTMLSAKTSIPIAAGENIHTGYRFDEFFERSAIAVAQPNIIRVGGITPFLAIAEQAAARGIVVHPHLLPELSGLLAMCLPSETLVENVEDSSFAALGVIEDSPIEFRSNRAELVDRDGLGLTIRGHDHAHHLKS